MGWAERSGEEEERWQQQRVLRALVLEILATGLLRRAMMVIVT